MSSEEDEENPPRELNDSRGSSVSSTIRNEYEELMKFVNIVPEKILTPSQCTAKTHRLNTPRSVFSDNDDKENSEQTRANSIDKWFGGSDGAVASAYGVLKTPVDVHPAGDIKLVGVGMRHGSSRDISLDEKLSRSQRSGKRQENTNSATSALELSLDKWCLDLRSMVLEQFSVAKLSVLEQQKIENEHFKKRFKEEKDKYLNQIDNLQNELEISKTENSEKDRTIEGLQTVIQKQTELMKKSEIMVKWRNEYLDVRREQMCLKMADIYFNRKLLAKSWAFWHSQIENKWRERVEKGCQLRAQEVCQKLEEKYESQLQELEKGLQESRMEIEAMQNEKLQYEENMRQAFLRGLSALNQEAHTIFQTPRSTQVTMVPTSVPSLSYAHSALNSSMTLPQSTTANQAGMASTQLFRSAEHTPLAWQKARAIALDQLGGVGDAVGALVDLSPTSFTGTQSLNSTSANVAVPQHSQTQQYFNQVQTSVQQPSVGKLQSPPGSARTLVTGSVHVSSSVTRQQGAVINNGYQPAVLGPPASGSMTPRTYSAESTSRKTSVTTTSNAAVHGRQRRSIIIEKHQHNTISKSSAPPPNPNLPTVKASRPAYR